MQVRAKKLIHDMLSFGRLALRFLGERSLEEYEADLQLRAAVACCAKPKPCSPNPTTSDQAGPDWGLSHRFANLAIPPACPTG